MNKIGQVYKIECNTTGLRYYGSTTQSLNKRLSGHICSYNSSIQFPERKRNSCSSFKVLENKNFTISCVEYVDIENLKFRERFHIENNDCVNISIPTRERLEWENTHRNRVLDYKKKWRDSNIEQMRWYDKNIRKSIRKETI